MRAVRWRHVGLAAAVALALVTTAGRVSAEIVVAIDKSAQRMNVYVDGVAKYTWTISTGLRGGPHNGSYRPQRLERKWYSRKYNWAPMPYSIFFDGNYAIHGTIHVRNLGRRASKGCVRLHPSNAAVLFDLVRRSGFSNTRIIVSNAAYVMPAKAKETVAEVASPSAADKSGHVAAELKPGLDQAAIAPAAGEHGASSVVIPVAPVDIVPPSTGGGGHSDGVREE